MGARLQTDCKQMGAIRAAGPWWNFSMANNSPCFDPLTPTAAGVWPGAGLKYFRSADYPPLTHP